MPVTRTLLALVAALTLLSSCGSTTSTDSATTTTTTIGNEPETPTSEVVAKEQPAIWPRADVVFATPEEAARDFVTSALGVAPVLGEFEQGDAHSGEIEVFSPGEGANPRAVSRGRLLLRQLGPDNGWFIIGAVNDNASITTPASMAEVAAGPLTVAGVARGFEANVIVSAFPAGDAAARFDQSITQGGAAATPEPFTVSLDLSGASPGAVVTLLVRGGVGLETDPGDFGAIPVVIAS